MTVHRTIPPYRSYCRPSRSWSACCFIALAFLLAVLPLRATISFTLEQPTDTLVGATRTVIARHEDTLPGIARANGLGFQEIKLANPDVDTWLPGQGTEIVLPTWYVLPEPPHIGLVLNIPEMRLYYFPAPETGQVITHPIGIGRQGWTTPYINTRIIEKKNRPYWHPPESIRREHAEQGEPLPKRVPPGPDNPLGEYALRLGLPEYLIHGTNKPYGIGMRVSHGCIRLYPENIESLYQQVALGAPVRIINQPYKVGRRGDKLYLEAHPYLEEDAAQFQGSLTGVVKSLIKITGENGYEIDWKLAQSVIDKRDGIPVEIGKLVEN
ncbi:MAG: L,D-transpeptidase family protein [Gammaproteobacteria bacterium]|nr:L,D-transpeptidase family protein [Gammaproteobacteria bacterium]